MAETTAAAAEAPRHWRLARFPHPHHPRREAQLVRYGGDSPDGAASVVSAVEAANDGWKATEEARRLFKKTDGGGGVVRVVACSPDGRRVAVGFEDGSTRIYAYDEDGGNNDGGNGDHPFLSTHKKGSTKKDDGGAIVEEKSDKNDDSDDDGELFGASLLTQSDGVGLGAGGCSQSSGDDEDDDDDSYFAGPRLSAPIRDLAFDPRANAKSGYHLAVASEASPGLCVVDASSPASVRDGGRLLEECVPTDDGGGVRGVAYSRPDGETNEVLLAAVGMDGVLTVYSLPDTDVPDVEWDVLHRDKSPAVSRRDLGSLASASASDVDDGASAAAASLLDAACLPVWSDDGSVLALPGSFDVQIRHRSDVSRKFFVHSKGGGGGHEDAVVAMGFARRGDSESEDDDGWVLVTSGRDGRACVWALELTSEDGEKSITGTFLRTVTPMDLNLSSESATTFTSLPTQFVQHSPFFGGKENKAALATNLFVITSDGTISTVPKSVLSAATSESEMSIGTRLRDDVDELDTQPPPSSSLISSAKKRLMKTSRGNNAHDSENDDGDDAVFDDDDAGSSKKGISVAHGKAFLDDEADEDDDDDATVDKNAPPSKDATMNISSIHTSTDKDEVLSLAAPEEVDDSFDRFHDDDDDDVPEGGNYPTQLVNANRSQPQEAFAPSSTPMTTSDHSRRIMCWNHIGTITSRPDDASKHNIIDISFTDSLRRSSTSPITDDLHFDVGSLGEDGAIFATCGASDECDVLEEAGSHVYFHRFESIGPLKDKDWTVVLPAGERALGCACGEGWAAVVTTRNFLRLFTTGGAQDVVLSLPGNPVTMVGRGRFVAVFYHDGQPLPDGTQQLGYTLFNATNGSPISSGHLSGLAKGTHLTWAGFSNDFFLSVMDSEGMVSMLVRYAGWSWAPILDTMGKKKSDDDAFWPVSLLDGRLICVPLKGGHEHPDAARRPVTTSLELRMPLAQGVLPKSTPLEDVCIRANLALSQKQFMNELNIAEGASADDLEDEYDAACAQVDKVTIKLFFDSLKGGKVERALDLVSRLHLDKSFDIVLTISDQFRHHSLSGIIEEIREDKFPPEDAIENPPEDGVFSGHLEGDHDNHSQYSQSSRITPDNQYRNHVSSENKRRRGPEADGNYYSESESGSPPPPRLSKKLCPTTDDKNLVRGAPKRLNPFAKKLVKSPGKAPKSSKATHLCASPSPSSKPALSRTSTFSAQSRKSSARAKHFL